MVGIRRFWVLWAALFVLSLFSWSAQAVEGIHVSSKTVELGKPVRVVVRGEEAVTFFQQKLLAHLAPDFFFDYQQEQADKLRVWLYPYRTGQFFVPEYAGNQVAWSQIELLVKPNPEIEVNWSSVKASGFVPESVDFAFSARVPDSAWRVEMIEPALSSDFKQRWQYQSMPVQKLDSALLSARVLYRGGAKLNYLGIVAPFTSQMASLPAPHIKVRSPGGSQWYFYRPPAAYTLMPLPSFLPLSILVAKPDLQQRLQPANLVLGEVNYWQWEIHAKGVSRAYLQAFAEQIVQLLRQIDEIEWFQPELSFTESLVIGQQSYEQVLRVSLPFRPLTWLWQQPELSLRYFDPQTEKLTVMVVPSQWHVSLPSWLLILLQGATVLLAIAFVWLSIYSGRFYWYRWRLQVVLLGKETRSMAERVEALFAWRTAIVSNQAFGRFTKPELAAQTKTVIEVQSLQSWLDWYWQNTRQDSPREAANQMIELLQSGLYAPQQVESTNTNGTELAVLMADWLGKESLLSQWRWIKMR